MDDVRNTEGSGTPIAPDEPDINMPPTHDKPDVMEIHGVPYLVKEDENDILDSLAMSDAESEQEGTRSASLLLLAA